MPVYLLTIHAYRSWSEDNPRGYVQHDHGLQRPDARRARWRREHAAWPSFRFDRNAQKLAHRVVAEISDERDLRLHACSTTPTHIHALSSFRSPACTCGASEHCRKRCPARAHAETFLARLKRKLGQQLATHFNTTGTGRKYLSHGWDLTPIRTRDHFRHLVTDYLPDHEATQSGLFHRYD